MPEKFNCAFIVRQTLPCLLSGTVKIAYLYIPYIFTLSTLKEIFIDSSIKDSPLLEDCQTKLPWATTLISGCNG